MFDTQSITIGAGEKLTIRCFECSTICRIEHEPTASRHCPQDVPQVEIKHCPYCGSENIEGD